MSLANRLRDARHASFVGREDEVRRFETLITSEDMPVQVLHVYGPGGVGKTTLLHEFLYRSVQHGLSTHRVDLEDVEPSESAVLRALRPVVPALREDAAEETRRVLLLDTYEVLRDMDDWVRGSLLPRFGGNTFVVIAGRHRPPAAWRTDPGWQVLAEEIALSNFTDVEARELLGRMDVPEDRHAAALNFTHGHPLALSLIADAWRIAPGAESPQMRSRADAPEVVQALMRTFLAEVPSDEHRAVLEVTAVVRLTTESLLTDLLGREAGDLFDWLRSLSFVEVRAEGLAPHDLARTALRANLRWRNPDRFDELHGAARRLFITCLRETDDPARQQGHLADYAYLYQDNPVAGPLIAQLRTLGPEGPRSMEPMREGEQEAVEALIKKHEGEKAAQAAAYWIERQPEGVEVARDASGAVAGVLVRLLLAEVRDEARRADPVAGGIAAALEEMPLRGAEQALVFRFWMAAEKYQGLSVVQSAIFARTVWHYLTTPRLAVSLLYCAVPHAWAPILAFAGLRPLPAADVELGGTRFEAFAHDWRREPIETWLATLADRSAASEPQPGAEDQPETPAVLSREAFEEAVKDVLRDFTRPHRLEESPLLQTRALRTWAGKAPVVEDVTTLVEAVARRMEGDPKEGGYFRAVEATYLTPAPSQHRAAEQLGVPFSTYRRHLRRGVDFVVDTLWAMEVDGAKDPIPGRA